MPLVRVVRGLGLAECGHDPAMFTDLARALTAVRQERVTPAGMAAVSPLHLRDVLAVSGRIQRGYTIDDPARQPFWPFQWIEGVCSHSPYSCSPHRSGWSTAAPPEALPTVALIGRQMRPSPAEQDPWIVDQGTVVTRGTLRQPNMRP